MCARNLEASHDIMATKERKMEARDQQILSAALSLTPAVRIAIAEKLYDSLMPYDEQKEALWIKECESRIDGYHSGELKTIPAEEVLAEFLD